MAHNWANGIYTHTHTHITKSLTLEWRVDASSEKRHDYIFGRPMFPLSSSKDE